MTNQIITTIFEYRYPFVVAGMLVFILYFFGPVRRWFFGWRAVIEDHSVIADAEIAVVLVHGTYARRARWTSPQGEFTKRLTEAIGPCNVSRLLWSGDNSHRQRLDAARVMSEWIQNQTVSHIYLVGHSHGGTIAAMAATSSHDARVSVITLSAPFISVTTRYAGFVPPTPGDPNFGEQKRLLLGTVLYIFAGASAIFVSIGQIGWALLFGFACPLLLLTAAVVSLGKIEQPMEWFIRLLGAKGLRLSEESRIDVAPDALLIIRATGDEASGFLAIGQMVSWLVFTLFRLIGSALTAVVVVERLSTKLIEKLFTILGTPLFFFLWMLPFLLLMVSTLTYVGPLKAFWDKFWYMAVVLGALMLLAIIVLFFRIISLLIEPALLIIGGVAAFILNLPFGLELAAASLLVSLSVEAAPIVRWEIVTVEGGKTLLAHSLLYYQSDVVARLLVWKHQSRRANG
jgi:pimeloyl-ACP methyl ester carboxylesterase